MSLIDHALHRSRTVILVLILLLAAGWVGYNTIMTACRPKMPNGFYCVRWNRNCAA